MFTLFFLLMVSHAVCDFALQNDYVAMAKNRHTHQGKDVWWMVLPYHALIHAGGVYVVTQSTGWSIFQFVVHVIVDFLKCDNYINYKQDQLLHVLTMLFITIFI